MSRPVETSKATQSMKRLLVPGELNPEQRHNGETKFRNEFIPIYALSSRLSLVVIANTLLLLDDSVIESQQGQELYFFFQNFHIYTVAHLPPIQLVPRLLLGVKSTGTSPCPRFSRQRADWE